MEQENNSEILLFDGEILDCLWKGDVLYETYALTSHRVIFKRYKDYVVIPYARVRGYELSYISLNRYNILFYGLNSKSDIYKINLSDEDIIEFNKLLSYHMCKQEVYG